MGFLHPSEKSLKESLSKEQDLAVRFHQHAVFRTGQEHLGNMRQILDSTTNGARLLEAMGSSPGMTIALAADVKCELQEISFT